jgi:Flp pilus assembly protein protease CpaA
MFMIYLLVMFLFYFVVTWLSLLYVMSYDIHVYIDVSYRLIVILLLLSNFRKCFIRVKISHYSVLHTSLGYVVVCLYQLFFYSTNYYDDLQY